MMKIYPVLMMFSFFIVSCGGVKHVEKDGAKVSYVNISSKGYFSKIYSVSVDDVPVWCELNSNINKSIRVLNSDLGVKRPKVSRYVACYSGERPTIENIEPQIERTTKLRDGVYFRYNPTEQFYLVGIKLETSCSNSMITHYFILYSEFCSAEDVECCLNGVDKEFFIYALIRPGIKGNPELQIKDLVNYLDHMQLDRSTDGRSYELFNSFIGDKCSMERFYVGAENMGIEDATQLLDREQWSKRFLELKTCKTGIKGMAILINGSSVPGTLDGILP